MPQPPDTASDAPSDGMDLRRVDDDALLAALGSGQPLALAEAYHRTVPAAHAVARRLVGGANAVEDLLLDVYAQLWSDPPAEGPLEGWVRRTTWATAADRLRADGAAPASPSAAGLLPDLPAPDVRFLDAAERAIAELADDERRALLLAHDKGVPTDAQDPGAGDALGRALKALAGPETSATDRATMTDDGCEDLTTLGDWCLGLLGPAQQAVVTQAIDSRPGCATASRTVRRGRRRIEGLPATPDMGQRVLVTVLTSGGLVAAPPPVDPGATVEVRSPFAPEAGAAAAGGTAAGVDDPGVDDIVAPPVDDDVAGVPIDLGKHEMADEGYAPSAAPAGDDGDPFADLDPTGPHIIEPVDDDVAPGAVGDTADLPQSAADPQTPTGSWVPGPADSTAELRLSDILSDEGDDDDPFADLDAPDPIEEQDDDRPPAGRRDPYSALRGLGEDEPLQPQGPMSPAFAEPDPVERSVVLPEEDEALVGGYVEGQEDHHGLAPARSGAGGMNAVLAWILPILGGVLVGVIGAIVYFGLPS